MAISSRSDLAYSHTALTVKDRERLFELVSEWQLVSDLSFADLILWPEGHIALAHIRPTTAPTIFAQDVIGQELTWGKNARIDQSLSAGLIIRDAEPEDFIARGTHAVVRLIEKGPRRYEAGS